MIVGIFIQDESFKGEPLPNLTSDVHLTEELSNFVKEDIRNEIIETLEEITYRYWGEGTNIYGDKIYMDKELLGTITYFKEV